MMASSTLRFLVSVTGFFTLIIAVGLTRGAQVDKCKDPKNKNGTYGLGEIEDVRISDCPEAPCILKKGTEATVEFDFKPDKTYEKLTTSVFGGLGLVKVPFRDVHNLDACKDITRKSDGKKGCPLEPEHLYTYSNSFPILKQYPAINVLVQYGLNDQKVPIVCFTLPAKITL